jgi:hypothetical protein
LTPLGIVASFIQRRWNRDLDEKSPKNPRPGAAGFFGSTALVLPIVCGLENSHRSSFEQTPFSLSDYLRPSKETLDAE